MLQNYNLCHLVEEIITDTSSFPPTPKSDLNFCEISFSATLAKKFIYLNFIDEPQWKIYVTIRCWWETVNYFILMYIIIFSTNRRNWYFWLILFGKLC